MAQAKTKVGDEADRLFDRAGEKYEAALVVNAKDHETLNNWGTALMEQAKAKSGDEADRLFERADEKYKTALALNPLHPLYNIACLHALRGQLDQAKQQLEKARDAGVLPSRAHIEADDDLVALRADPWFEAFLDSLD